ARGRANASPDGRAFAASDHAATDRAHPGAHSGRLYFATPVTSLAFDFALIARRLQSVLSGQAGDGRHQRNPSALGLDFVEAEQQARMQAIAHRAYVSLDLAAAQQHGFVRTGQVVFELRFEALSRLNAAGIELVLQANQK